MKLHGSIIENLENAIASARRLRERPIYADTLVYWNQLLQKARRARAGMRSEHLRPVEAAIAQLETELANRKR